MAENVFEKPITPTGSGVADLEIAREQAALSADEGLPEQPPMDGAAGGSQAEAGKDIDHDLPLGGVA